jgi:small-conductance mechanosensitive channel
MNLLQNILSLSPIIRIFVIILFAIAGHFIVKAIKYLSQWLLTLKIETKVSSKETFLRRYPKFATLMTILVSAVTFVIYFMAIGLILKEFKISLTTYLASASVIGLAIGFGLQGFVQDVVIGLTLIFSDAINIGDMAELSGQMGKVESIGLRFTTLINFYGQEIYIPNRNIGSIGRFRRGVIRSYVDIQIMEQVDEQKVLDEVQIIASGMYNQHKSIILSEPELFDVKEAKPGNWKYLRIKFRIWPGQISLIETTFKQRILSSLKKLYADYTEWMITITYRIE